MAQDDVKITLHWLNGSRAQGTLWLLEELQVPYELDVHHRLPSKLAPPALEKIHPLGKSPLVTVNSPALAEPIVLAESGFIVQYMSEHFLNARKLFPTRWKEGREGTIGGETEEWMRYQYLMYYAEGSFMATVTMHFVMMGLKSNSVPFLIRPLTKLVANQVQGLVTIPNMKKHFTLLEQYLETSPGGGNYLCGTELTGVDIMLAYPLQAGSTTGMFEEMASWEKGSFKDTFPKLTAYNERISKEAGWLKSEEKIKEVEGKFSLLP